jgi:hypothetical protein
MSREETGWRGWIRRLLRRAPPPAPAVQPVPSPGVLDETPEESLAALRAINAAPTNEARFVCAVHGTEAATVQLFRRHSGASRLEIRSVLAATLTLPVPEDEAQFGDPVAEGVQGALNRGNVIDLHLADARFTPFFCPACAAVYCKDCWTLDEVMDDDDPDIIREARVICPREHVNVLMRFSP